MRTSMGGGSGVGMHVLLLLLLFLELIGFSRPFEEGTEEHFVRCTGGDGGDGSFTAGSAEYEAHGHHGGGVWHHVCVGVHVMHVHAGFGFHIGAVGVCAGRIGTVGLEQFLAAMASRSTASCIPLVKVVGVLVWLVLLCAIHVETKQFSPNLQVAALYHFHKI